LYFSLCVFPKFYLHVVVGRIWSCLLPPGNGFILHRLIIFLTLLTLDRTSHDERAILIYFSVRLELFLCRLLLLWTVNSQASVLEDSFNLPDDMVW
jgi:hypothetical protein